MTTPIHTLDDALQVIFRTRRNITTRGLDEHTRNIAPTRNMMLKCGLPAKKREYCVVTGSKGKGSTAAITAKVLQHLGHKVGLITSPHLVTWFERIRIDGKAIPEADFLRLVRELEPIIAAEEAKLNDGQYISPQGVLLLMALKWWDENDVTAAVVEVGRGGRFDDMSLVPNKVALFTPIFLEHAQYLGDSVERIAWHKAGIIKQASYVYSVAQDPKVLDVISREADAKDAEMFWFSSLDVGEYVGDTEDGIRFKLGRYGEVTMPTIARYQIPNATLAVQAAGNMHARLQGISHGNPEYVERVRAALADVTWHGRMQKLQENPRVFVDGAANVLSAKTFLQSIAGRSSKPLITILGVPRDRDVAGVYEIYAQQSDALIITETDIHRNIHFPTADDALAIARQFHADVAHRKTLPQALDLAYQKAGTDGTILLAVAQPLVGEAMLIWKIDTTQI